MARAEQEKLDKIRDAATLMCAESFIVITPHAIVEYNPNNTILQEMSDQIHKMAVSYGIITDSETTN